MTRRHWSGDGPVLADTSAWTASDRRPDVAAGFDSAVSRRDVWWCWPVRLELLLTAEDPRGMAVLDSTLARLREVPVDRSLQRAVIGLMWELAESGSHGAHRYPLTDLTVAVAAQSAGLAILHHDQHLERLADHLGVPAYWI